MDLGYHHGVDFPEISAGILAGDHANTTGSFCGIYTLYYVYVGGLCGSLYITTVNFYYHHFSEYFDPSDGIVTGDFMQVLQTTKVLYTGCFVHYADFIGSLQVIITHRLRSRRIVLSWEIIQVPVMVTLVGSMLGCVRV